MPLLSTLTNIGLLKRRKSSSLAEVLVNHNAPAPRPAPAKHPTLLAQTQHLAHAAQVTLINIRAEPPLAEVLVSQKPKPILVNYSERPSFLARTRQLFHDLFGNTRQQYQQSLTTSYDVMTEQAAKQEMKRNFLVVASSLGLAMTGVLISPLFYWLSAGCTLYASRALFQEGYRTVVEKRRLNYRVVLALTVPATLMSGFISAAAIGVIFIMGNRYLVTITENRSKQSITDLFGGQTSTVWRLVEGVEIETPLEQIWEGDIVVVQAGQMIPVDGLITTGRATIDQQMLTGEAQPVEKDVGDTVLAATVVLTGCLYIRVQKAGQATVAAQIIDMLNQTTDFKQALRSRTDHWLNQLLIPMLGLSALSLPLAGLSGAVSVLWYYPGSRMMVFGPLSMLSYLQVAAQKGILVKDGRALERLAEVDTVVFDKTGTLTLEQPTVSQVYSYSDLTKTEVLRYAAAAEVKQSHPIARAIVQAATEHNLELPSLADIEYKVGYGLKVDVEGQTIWVGSLRFMELEEVTIPTEVISQQSSSHAQGHSLVLVATNDEVIGAIELQPTIRPEAKEVVRTLQARGLETVIISGDNKTPTQQLAAGLGIDHYFAEVLPEEKAKLVEQLQAEGRTVCFVGDGINDSIALKTADVSISLQGATTIATDMAQIVFMDGTLGQLPTLFDLTDEFITNMRFTFLAATLPGVVGIAGTMLFGWGITLCVVFLQVSTPLGIYNALKPLLDEGNHQVKLLP